MTAEQFLDGMKKFNQRNLELWQSKNKEYANLDDVFKNFNEAAKMTIGKKNNYVAAWNFAVKHLVSVSDIIKKPSKFSDEQIAEKFGDLIIYLHMIHAMITEERYEND